ncbi:MAG: tRNA 2-thiocytidine biosynthesis TtcA family protein [Firmicutes bacterium]|nr:tRNA 2-thiocytidine biosynthesis TtcA family protein [Bacillota bacterium]
MSNILGSLRKTIQEKQLISDGDRVAVGLSGGKDSMALLSALKRFQSFSPIPFTLTAVTIDMGFENFDLEAAKAFCHSLEVPYHIIPTDIAKIVFELRDEKNPCALCANMRRGALASAMKSLDLNVLALGHHADDALSTLFLNMLYSGKLNTLEYHSFLSRSEIHVIRPFLDTSEANIIHYVKSNHIPVLKSPCPMDRKTKRETMNHLLSTLYKEIPHSRVNLLTAMRNKDQCNLFDSGFNHL